MISVTEVSKPCLPLVEGSWRRKWQTWAQCIYLLHGSGSRALSRNANQHRTVHLHALKWNLQGDARFLWVLYVPQWHEDPDKHYHGTSSQQLLGAYVLLQNIPWSFVFWFTETKTVSHIRGSCVRAFATIGNYQFQADFGGIRTYFCPKYGSPTSNPLDPCIL